MLLRTNLLIAFILISQAANAETYGSWVTETDTGLYAATSNDSGAVLGQFCYVNESACVYLIGIAASCDEGDQYPVLANSDAGAQQLQLICGGKMESGLFRYTFADFEAVDTVVRSGNRIGIAIPLQQDQFRVIRFKLDGAVKAVNSMRATGLKRTKSMTTDQTL